MIGALFRRVLNTEKVTIGTAPNRLIDDLTLTAFNTGTTRLTIQNIDSADNAEWSYSTTGATSGQMGILVPYQSIVFNWEVRYLNDIWIAGADAGKLLYIMEEGI